MRFLSCYASSLRGILSDLCACVFLFSSLQLPVRLSVYNLLSHRPSNKDLVFFRSCHGDHAHCTDSCSESRLTEANAQCAAEASGSATSSAAAGASSSGAAVQSSSSVDASAAAASGSSAPTSGAQSLVSGGSLGVVAGVAGLLAVLL